jgi:hypothetical protein
MVNTRFPAGDARALADMEGQLSLLLSGEGGRCAFLRSHSYIQFRMAALYRTRTSGDPLSVWVPSGDVRLEYTPDSSGGYISLCSAPIPFCFAHD